MMSCEAMCFPSLTSLQVEVKWGLGSPILSTIRPIYSCHCRQGCNWDKEPDIDQAVHIVVFISDPDLQL